MLRISLIMPPVSVLPCPAWSLVNLAAALPADNIQIKLFDLNKSQWRGLASPWNEIKADIIGVSANFSIHHEKYVSFLRELRQRFPSALIIIGGCHVTAVPSLFSSLSCVDHVVVGSGEIAMNSIDYIFANTKILPRILSSKSFNRSLATRSINLGSFAYYSEILGITEYDHFHLDCPSIIYKGLPSRQVFFRRKCPFNCRHCVENIASDTVPDNIGIDDLINYIALQNSKSSASHCYFLDPTLNAYRDSLAELCQALANRFSNIVWGCKARIELLDADLIRTMAQAGCRFIEIGLEAFDDDSLDSLRRPHISDSVLFNLDALTANGISIQCNFLLGLPSDTPATLESRVKRAHRMMSFYNMLPCFWLFCPFPGSEIWSQLKLAENSIRWEDLSTTPLAKYGQIRYHYANLPSRVSASQMSQVLQFAWDMPSELVEKWFRDNQLFQAAASEYQVSIDTLICSLFPHRIGDFTHSKFFVV